MINISKVKVVDKSKGMEDNIKVLDNTKYAPSLTVLCFWLCFATYLLTGRHKLRSFLAASSTQNYFLIARMLRFL